MFFLRERSSERLKWLIALEFEIELDRKLLFLLKGLFLATCGFQETRLLEEPLSESVSKLDLR